MGYRRAGGLPLMFSLEAVKPGPSPALSQSQSQSCRNRSSRLGNSIPMTVALMRIIDALKGKPMTTWLYRVRPSRPAMLTEGPTPAEQEAVGRHFAYLQGLCRAGVMHLAGRTLNGDEEGFGICLFSAGSEEEARRVMEGDPAVIAGVMSAQLFPYRVALLNTASLAEAADLPDPPLA